MPDHVIGNRTTLLWSGQNPSKRLSDDPQIDLGGLRAILAVTPGNFTQARNMLFRFGQRDVAAADAGAGADEATRCIDQLLEHGIERRERNPRYRPCPHDAALQLGDFAERGLDAVLNRADL